MKKKKINLIDAVIVISVILICFVMFLGISRKSSYDRSLQNNSEIISFTVKTSDFDSDYGNYIKSGDIVTDADTGIILGIVDSVVLSEYITEDGQGNNIPYPDRLIAEITVNRNFRNNINREVSQTVRMIIGERYNLAVPGLYFSCECISIKELENDINIFEPGNIFN